MDGLEISSPTNERIKRLVRLRQRTHRDQHGVFVVEGDRLVDRARTSGFDPIEIYVVPGHPLENHPKSTIVAPEVLDKASYRTRSQGLVAVFKQFSTRLADIKTGPDSLVLIAESVEKPGNLGAILRTADAVGATAVITTGTGVDLFNPNVIRTSTGAVFSVSFAHAQLGDLVAWLDNQGMRLVLASPAATTNYWDADLTGPLAILVGAEHKGVSAEAASHARNSVAIPMAGMSDSLNVSVSTALLAFEAKRQRSNH
jgi:TrmH family RNA methyltransferase